MIKRLNRWDRDQQMISSRLGGDLICTNYESLSGQGLGPLDLIHSWNMHHNDQISDHIWSLVTDWSKAKDDLDPIHNWNMQKSEMIRVWSKSGEDNPPQPHLHLLLEKLLFFILQRLITIIWTARLWSLNNQHNGQNVGLITVTAKVQNQTNSPERTNWSQLVSIGWRKWTPAQIRIDPIGVENASWRSHWVQKWNLMLRLEKMQKSKALTWQLSVGWD